MKYIKTYEANSSPRVGEYVICGHRYDMDVNDYLSSNIGVLIDRHEPYNYIVRYDNIPNEYSKFFDDIKDTYGLNITDGSGVRSFSLGEIVHHSKHKEDLDMYINVEQFNI